MSRTNRGSKGPGYEYWSRRPTLDWNIGAEAKRFTHRAERREGEEEISEQLGLDEDDELFLCPYCGQWEYWPDCCEW